MDTNSQNGANGSSDFVKKLYKMLEDPSYSQIVRWGDEHDSFVVLENEKFTKQILPKHFKHSNFASFVRQLNKYDFHKVRHNNEENSISPYGPGAWEFKHPDFKANNRDALDNIRRKAPAPRKATNTYDDMPSAQLDIMSTQLAATQQQLRMLEERYNELHAHHSMAVTELIGLQKTVVNHEHVIQNVMSFLHGVDAKHRRESKIGGPFANHPDASIPPQENDLDVPASPLAKASNLLNEFNADAKLNFKTLEQLTDSHFRTFLSATPGADSRTGAAKTSTGTATGSPAYAKMNIDLDNMVYPIGQTIGIDPAFGEHLQNIPYSMPPKEVTPAANANTAPRKKSGAIDPGWIRKPQILLVEDDPTCRRIGSKFLYSFQCSIDSAFDGLEAVEKLNAGSKYDLILMDIIMPHLDGVSACHLIRQFDNTPIIAMTSNIRSDDISMYFTHGMNDVLPKPFTKDGLLHVLEKHLAHLKQDPVSGFDSIPQSATSLSHSLPHGLKSEASPADSPSTVTNWSTPTHMHNLSNSISNSHVNPLKYSASPIESNVNAFGIDTSGLQAAFPIQNVGGVGMSPGSGRMAPPANQGVNQNQNHRRQVSDLEGGDEMGGDAKRQRMYGVQAQMGGVRR